MAPVKLSKRENMAVIKTSILVHTRSGPVLSIRGGSSMGNGESQIASQVPRHQLRGLL